jgi:hypothetical protein
MLRDARPTTRLDPSLVQGVSDNRKKVPKPKDRIRHGAERRLAGLEWGQRRSGVDTCTGSIVTAPPVLAHRQLSPSHPVSAYSSMSSLSGLRDLRAIYVTLVDPIDNKRWEGKVLP